MTRNGLWFRRRLYWSVVLAGLSGGGMSLFLTAAYYQGCDLLLKGLGCG